MRKSYLNIAAMGLLVSSSFLMADLQSAGVVRLADEDGQMSEDLKECYDTAGNYLCDDYYEDYYYDEDYYEDYYYEEDDYKYEDDYSYEEEWDNSGTGNWEDKTYDTYDYEIDYSEYEYDYKNMDYGKDEAFDYFESYYGDDYDYEEYFEDFDYKEVEYVAEEIDQDKMEEYMKHFEDEHAKDMYTMVFNNLDVLDEKATQMLEYSTALFEVIADLDVDAYEGPQYDVLEDLYKDSFVLLSEESSEKMVSLWKEIIAAVESGETDFKAYIEKVSSILKENDEDLVKEGIQYYDVKMEDESWYYDEVMGLKNEGILTGYKDSDGELTGYFAPEATITYAEMLKLALEVSQQGESSETPSDTTAQGQWYEGYVAQAETLELSIVGSEWNKEITRHDAVVLISEVLGLYKNVDAYEGQFPDVSTSDSDAIHFAAVYEYGVFTGDADTGNLRPTDTMNRAEAAKVVFTAMEALLSESVE